MPHAFLHRPGRSGAFGALLDEYARAAEDYCRVVDQGDMRPMRNNPRAMAELRQILTAREPAYALADLTALTSGHDVEGVAGEIAAWVAGG